MRLKTCNRCKVTKKIENFYKDCTRRDGLSSRCKKCESEKSRKYHNSNKEKRNLQNKEWYHSNLKQERLRSRDKFLRRAYDLSLKEYESKLKEQPFCIICKSYFDNENPGCVDHDHITGEIRDLLCRSCNAGLGLFKEDIKLFKKAIKYLQRWER